MLKLQCEWGCSVTSCHSDITDLEILVGGGRDEGGGVVHKNPIPHCRPNERRKINILHFKDLFLFHAKSVHTSEIVLTYNQKINFGIIYNYQHHNYQKLFNYEAFTLSCDLKTAIKTWPVTQQQVPCLPSNHEYFTNSIKKLKIIERRPICHHYWFPIQRKSILKLLR